MSEVISLKGEPLPKPGEPNEILVGFLEDALAKAKAGEIVGMCGCINYSDHSGGLFLSGKVGGYSALGAMDIAHQRLRMIVGREHLT